MRVFLCLIVFISPQILFGEDKMDQNCSVVVFENIGYCPDHPGDFILSSKPYNELKTFFKDSTYKLPDIYSGRMDFTAIHECYDSLNLNNLVSVVSQSSKKLKFLKSELVKKNNFDSNSDHLSAGSLQIKFYSNEGRMTKSFYCEGMINTSVWLKYISNQIIAFNDFVVWQFPEYLEMIDSILKKGCTGFSEEE